MDPRSGEASNARKRKTKETAVVAQETAEPVSSNIPLPPVRYFPVHSQPHFNYSPSIASPFRLDLNTQPQFPSSLLTHENKDLYYPFKSSLTSLLTGGSDHNDLPAFVKEQNAYVDQLITAQGNQLRRTLGEIQRRQYLLLAQEAEEKTAKRFKDRELKLREMGRKNGDLEHDNVVLKKEIKRLENKVKHLENSTESYRAQIQEFIRQEGKAESAGCSEAQPRAGANEEQEDMESSHVDPNRLEPIFLACKACGKRLANVMMWPCRHVCACKACDASITACPVCSVLKTATIELCLP